MLLHLLVLVACFAVVWFSSGIVVKGVEKLAYRLKLSRFAVSVFLLGGVTSLPEIGVLVNSLLLNTPEVSLGNLIGGQMYILFFIIPLLAMLVGNIHLHSALQGKSLIITLLVLGAPLGVLFDGQINLGEGWLLFVLYVVFIVVYWKKMSVLERVEQKLHHVKNGDGLLLLKVLGGMGLILLTSNRIVTEIHTLSGMFNLHEFFVSMIVMAVGTNIPELSLMFRGLVTKRCDVALGNYVGSAALNSFLMTLLVVGKGGNVTIHMNLAILLVLMIGVVSFWYFARSKGTLSRSEGLCLLGFYLLFIGVGLYQEMVT
jgi:cation:H+ antiporter